MESYQLEAPTCPCWNSSSQPHSLCIPQSPQGTLSNDGNPLVPTALSGTDPSYALASQCGVAMTGQVLISVSLLWDTFRGHTTELLWLQSQQGSRDSSSCKLPWHFSSSIRMHAHPAPLPPTVQLLLPLGIILWDGFSPLSTALESCPATGPLQSAERINPLIP